MTTNEHTGDKLISKPANDAFREGWNRIFGETDEELEAKENDVPLFLKDQAC